MSCCNSKDCDCHQNSSFIFGLIIGLVIAAVIAIVIYKNNRQDVLLKLKKQLENFFNNLKPKTEEIIESFIAPDLPKKKILKKKKKVSPIKIVVPELHKKEVTIPKNLIIADTTPKTPVSKPRKMFKK
jgi:hypothetical protein